MKFAVIADLHLHNHREFGRIINFECPWDGVIYPANSRLVDQLLTLDDLFQRVYDKGIRILYTAGDLFHVRGTVPSDVLQLSLLLFQHWAAKGMRFRALAGNHDQMDADGVYHASAAFTNVFTHVVGDKQWFKVKNPDGSFVMVHLLAWVENRQKYLEELDHCQQLVRTNPHNKHVLITHAAIDGAEVGTLEYRLKEPIFVEDLAPQIWSAVFMGHFHKPQKMADNVWYVGSPYQITRAEREDVKRALIYDTETGKVTQIKTSGPQFYQMFFDDIATGNLCLQHGYYDIIVRDVVSHGKKYQYDPSEVRARMAELNVPDFHLVRPRTEDVKKARMKFKKHATDKQILEAFLKAKGVEDTGDLVEAGLACLQGTAAHGAQAKEIIFEKVRVRNFMSLGKANLSLHQPGSVIGVLGENLDASGMDSNGSGKSSLLPEALFWCLYGSTIRNIPVDRVVNTSKKRNCFVQLRLQVDGQSVVITRYRKHEEHGNVLSLVVDGVDRTQGTNPLTQGMVDSLIGISMDAFVSIMAFSPDSLNFVSATDASKKQILDSIIHTERYVEAARRAKSEVTRHSERLAEANTLLTSLNTRIEVKEEHIQDLEAKDKESMELQRKDRLATKAKLKQLKKDIEEIQENQLAPLEEEIETLTKEAGALRAKIPDMSATMDARDRTNTNLRAAEHKLVELGTRQSVLSTNIAKLMKATGKECPTCHQIISGTHVGKTAAKMDRELTELVAQQKPLETEKLNLTEAVAGFNLKLRAGEQTRKELDALTKKLESKHSTKHNLDAEVQSLQKEVDDLETPKEVTAYQDFKQVIKQTKDEVEKLREELEEAQEHRRLVSNLINTYKQWVDWFGNKGIKSFMLDRIIPALTQYANDFADQLTDGDIRIEFDSNSDGSDKFVINAYNSEGSELYGGNSSGERRRIDICVMFALFRLANEQTNINVLLLDEVFDTVDTVGLERVVTMIHTLATDLDLTIFVTSHTDLRKWLHESIVVSKQDRIATLK